jgi:hypothetical protein
VAAGVLSGDIPSDAVNGPSADVPAPATSSGSGGIVSTFQNAVHATLGHVEDVPYAVYWGAHWVNEKTYGGAFMTTIPLELQGLGGDMLIDVLEGGFGNACDEGGAFRNHKSLPGCRPGGHLDLP